MLIENKVQIEAIKTRDYFCSERDGIVYISNGSFIVYVKQKDCLLDITKQKNIFMNEIEHFWYENVMKKARKATVSNRVLIIGRGSLRGIKDDETGKYFWFDNRYFNMFKNCKVFLLEEDKDGFSPGVFTRYGEPIGVVLPVRTKETWGE